MEIKDLLCIEDDHPHKKTKEIFVYPIRSLKNYRLGGRNWYEIVALFIT